MSLWVNTDESSVKGFGLGGSSTRSTKTCAQTSPQTQIFEVLNGRDVARWQIKVSRRTPGLNHVLRLLPRKALREEGQATENLLAAVELLHVRGGYHGDALVVLDAEVVHAETVAHCDKGRGTLCGVKLN